METELTRRWGLAVPIVGAPMAYVGGGRLAAAISSAGGLGMIGVGGSTAPRWVRAEAELAAAGGRFGFGLMAWVLDSRPELLDAVLAARPFAVSVSFGDPAPYAERVRAAGAVLVTQVSDRDDAHRAVDAGADVLVAQGAEAGGHTSTVGTLPLLDVVLGVGERAGVPVLAAGGIATGRALAGVLAMGASGAWVGTRFAASTQASGTDAAKKRIVAAGEADTVHTRVFDVAQGLAWPERYPGRAVRNGFSARWHGREAELAERRDAAAAELAAARERDDYDTMYVYAGQASGLVDAVEDAGAIVARMARDAEEYLRGTASVVGSAGHAW